MLKQLSKLLRGSFLASQTNRPSTRRQLHVDALEDRKLLTVITYSNGVTNVAGTNLREVVAITPFTAQGGAPMHRFSVNGIVVAEHPEGNRINVGLLGGNDGLDARNVRANVQLSVNGGDGNDNLVLGNGNDVAYGNAGNDRIVGGAGNDTLHGGIGNDTLIGGAGNDWMNGNDGADTVNMQDGNAAIWGDRNVNPKAEDTVLRDAFQPIARSAQIVNPHTNQVRFTGGRVVFGHTETQDIFDLNIDDHDYGLWRDDVGRIDVNSYYLTVDAAFSDGSFFWNQLG